MGTEEQEDLISRLVVCVIGHVTDPYVDIDTRTGRPASEQLTPSTALAKSAYFERAHLEKGDPRWQTQCRRIFNTGEHRAHQCRRQIHGRLCEHDDLEAAYRVGGERAVITIFEARHGRR